MTKFLILFLPLILANCTHSENWNILLFGEGNDIPYSAIYLQDDSQYIILGQKWTKTDSIEYGSALVKIDQDGSVIKQYFYEGENEEHCSILQLGKRIFIAGFRDDKLNIIEIDKELNMVRDTLLAECKTTSDHYPKLLPYKSNMIAVFNNSKREAEIAIVDASLNRLRTIKIANGFYEGFISYNDAVITKNNKMVVTGTLLHFPLSPNGPYNYDVFFAQVDLETGAHDWIRSYGNNEGYFASQAIMEWNGNLYATGMGRNNDGGASDQFDVYLWKISSEGVIEFTKIYTDSESSDWGNDIEVVDNQILIAGFSSRNNQDSDFLKLLVNENGDLIERKKSGERQVSSLESIIKIDDKNVLLLGCSTDKWGPNSWDIRKIKNADVLN